jgi:hypothetical protein
MQQEEMGEEKAKNEMKGRTTHKHPHIMHVLPAQVQLPVVTDVEAIK